MRPRRLSEFPLIDGERFLVREEHFAFHGFGVRSRESDERLAVCPNQGMAEVVCEALEWFARNEPEAGIEVRL